VNPNTIDPSRIILELKPGSTYQEEISIDNEADIPLKIKVYTVDPKLDDEKKPTPASEKDPKISIGKWLTFNANDTEFDLKAKESKKITGQFSIPQDTKPGKYFGYIIAQKERPDEHGIIIVTRVAYIVDLNITDTPKEIPHLYNNAPSPYLIGSIIIFVLCVGYYVYEHKKEKKHNRHKEENKV
jgi:hypothetical protein